MSLPSIAVTVPTWRRGEMFRQCVMSLLEQSYKGHIEIMCVVDYEPLILKDLVPPPNYGWAKEMVPGDLEIAQDLQKLAENENRWNGLRSVRIKRGPGRSNWRPGAIHFPVFEHWMQTKCDFVTYQFSDELSGPLRFERQINVMATGPFDWSYCTQVNVIDGAGQPRGSRSYYFQRERVPCNQLMTPSILVDRNAFEEAGGLDYPLHAAAKAEEWIQTHCALVDNPVGVPGPDMYYFREHEESLGHGQGPGSKTYLASVAETGWVEEDHWRLWNHIAEIHDKRAQAARSMTE